MRISHAFRGWADLVSIAMAFPRYSVRNASRPESIASAVRVRVLEDSRLPPSKVPVDTVSCVCECNGVMLRKDVRLTCKTFRARGCAKCVRDNPRSAVDKAYALCSRASAAAGGS